jgi:hypothetical protein
VSRYHDHHRPVRLRDPLNPIQRFEAIDTGQPDIQDHQFEDRPGQQIQTRLAILDRFDLKALVFQDAAEGVPNAGFVIDDQYARSLLVE